MCLIFIAYQQHADFRLVVAANRDEFYMRPTAVADYWNDAPQVLAGRDLQAGGTWLGVTRSGRFAAVTNYRESAARSVDARSRGELVGNFLLSDDATVGYSQAVHSAAHAYNGFSLLLDDGERLAFLSNRTSAAPRILDSGVFGLSNHLLDTPWSKVQTGKRALRDWVDAPSGVEDLFRMMALSEPVCDGDLPSTGVPLALERDLSPRFVATETYGTRSTSVVLVGYDGHVQFYERTFEPKTKVASTVSFKFKAQSAAKN